MSEITVSCPSCTARLKLPDASLVGKRARCPRCSERFVVQPPASSDASTAARSAAAAFEESEELPVLPAAPMQGQAARWVPDDAPAAAPVPAPSAQPAPAPLMPVVPQIDLSVAPGAEDGGAGTSTVERFAGRRRRKGKSSATWVSLTVTGLLVLAVTTYFWLEQRGGRNDVAGNVPAKNPGWEQEKQQEADSNIAAEQLSPTDGKPVSLSHIPFTPHLICHLHPADLWSSNAQMSEFRALLGDVGLWLENFIQTRTRYTPQEISELTIAVNFGPRMTEPDLALVVRLDERQTIRDLERRFGGRMRPDLNSEAAVYEAADAAFLLVDEQTFVAASLTLAESLADYSGVAALASPDMEALIQQSDRDRHFSLIFDREIIDSHREDVFQETLLPAADRILFWFGGEVESVCWSMHLDPDCYMEFLMHNSSDSTPRKVQRNLLAQLDQLPEDILGMVRMMRPGTLGTRQMIGRFPAMVQALRMGTTAHVAPGMARLVTVLPQNAAANLAAASVLTWNQSLVTDFEAEMPVASGLGKEIPDKLEDRLRMKVLVIFNRTPLQEALGYIAESIGTELVLDGDGLKLAGFTQNMAQTLELGEVTALEGLDGIMQRYAKEGDPLVLVVDEQKKQLIVTVKSKAAADGLQVYDTASK